MLAQPLDTRQQQADARPKKDDEQQEMKGKPRSENQADDQADGMKA